MRKFALLPLFFGLASFGLAEAQVRDLFAEFEQEAVSSAVENSTQDSSSAKSSSSVIPTSSVALDFVTSSSIAPVSSAVTPVSSSIELSSSAVVTKDTVAVLPSIQDSLKVKDTLKILDSAIVNQDSLSKEQSYTKAMNAVMDSNKVRDSLVTLSSSSVDNLSSSSSLNLSSSSMSRRDLLGPVKVSKVHSIDEMKGKYKSPRKALFMSLVLPGSGQLYVGSSKFTYARGAIYLAIEAGLWTGWYYNSVHKYNKQVDKYKKYADEHYSIGRYENGMYDLFTSLDDKDQENLFVERYMNSRQSFCEALYGEAADGGCYSTKSHPYSQVTSHKKLFGENPKPLGIERKEKFNGDFYESAEVYQQIGGAMYVLGWDDVDDVAVASSLVQENANQNITLGISKNREKYRSMRNKANDLADMQAWFFGGLILNHLVSAIDAVFTANSHNKTLYEEELSWYNRLHFDSNISLFDGFGIDVRASWGF